MIVIGQGVVEYVTKYPDVASTGIGWLRDGKIIAGVSYSECNGVNVNCHIRSDGTKRWATREYLRTIFDYPFNQLKVRRITVCVDEGNTDSRRFVLHLGFTLETTLKSAHPTGDLLIFSMFRNGCRWLREVRHEKLAA